MLKHNERALRKEGWPDSRHTEQQETLEIDRERQKPQARFLRDTHAALSLAISEDSAAKASHSLACQRQHIRRAECLRFRITLVFSSSLLGTTACSQASSTRTSALASASLSMSSAMSTLAPAVAQRMFATPTAQSVFSWTPTPASAGLANGHLVTMSSALVPPGDSPLLGNLKPLLTLTLHLLLGQPLEARDARRGLQAICDAVRALFCLGHPRERCASQPTYSCFCKVKITLRRQCLLILRPHEYVGTNCFVPVCRKRCAEESVTVTDENTKCTRYC